MYAFDTEVTKPPHQTIIGVTNLVGKQADHLDQAATSTEAIQDYIHATIIGEDAPTERAENATGTDVPQNVVDSTGRTVARVSVSLDNIHEQLTRLHVSLTKFGEEASRQCEESISDNKNEVSNKITVHIDCTKQLVADTVARLESTCSDRKERKEIKETSEEMAKTKIDRNTPNAYKSKTTIVTDSERDQYETEIQQMKVIIDNLEDELESLKQECTEAVNSMDAANERMQQVEERVLDERLSHEVAVNALRAVIERQDEIMKSFNGSAVNDIWLENQKKRLFSKELFKDDVDDNNSEETCFDLIYVDQNSLKGDNRNHHSKEENKPVSHRYKDATNHNSSSRTSFNANVDDIAATRREVSENEDTRSEAGKETDTQSGVLLSFPYKNKERMDSRISDASKRMEEKEDAMNSDGATMVTTTPSRTPDMSDAIPDNSKAKAKDTHDSRVVIVNDINPTTSNGTIQHPESCTTRVRDQENPPTRCAGSEKTDSLNSTTNLKKNEIQTNKHTLVDKDQPTVLECSTKASLVKRNPNNTRNVANDHCKNDTSDKGIVEQSNSELAMKNADAVSDVQNQPTTNVQTMVPANDSNLDDSYTQIKEAEEEIFLFDEGVTKEIIYKRRDGEVDGCLSYYRDVGAIIRTTVPALGIMYMHLLTMLSAHQRGRATNWLYGHVLRQNVNYNLYKRSDGEVDGCLSYYRGVGAIIRTTVPALGAETLTCDVTDAVMADMLPDLVEGERAISFHINIQKKYGADVTRKDAEFIQIFVPHRSIPAHEEAVLVCSVNGEDWEQCDVIDATPSSLRDDVKVLCTELSDVTDVKLVVIARAKTVHLIGGEDDVMYQSAVDPGITVKLNTECFPARCGVDLMVHHIHQTALPTAVEIHVECGDVVSCTAFVSLVCERTTTEDVYVLMTLEPGQDYECKYTMFLLEDTGWKLADCDWNKTSNVLTIHLMAGAKKYRVIGLELSHDLSVEERLLAARTLHQHTGHYTMRALFKQKESDPSQAVVICLRANLVEQGTVQLRDSGYSIGGPPSEQFCLTDGDTLAIQCSGDIAAKPFMSRRMEMPFYSQKEIATKQLTLYPANSDVKPGAKMYQGSIHVQKGKQAGYVVLAETIHMPVENNACTRVGPDKKAPEGVH